MDGLVPEQEFLGVEDRPKQVFKRSSAPASYRGQSRVNFVLTGETQGYYADFAEGMQNSGVFQRPVEILTTTTEAVEDTTVVRFAVKAELLTSPTPDVAEQAGRPAAVASAAVPRTGA